MKIRTGFVSNSSSSSYIVITEKSTYERIFNSLSRLEKGVLEVLRKMGNIKKIEKFGKELVQLSYTSGNISSFENEEISPDFELTEEETLKLEDFGPDSILNEITDKITRAGECITHGEEF